MDEKNSQFLALGPERKSCIREMHQAEPGDFEEIKWILQYGDTEVWYAKPGKLQLRQMARQERAGREPDALPMVRGQRVANIANVRVWASAALSTPLIYELGCCSSGHSVDSDLACCLPCKEEKQDALASISLQYCVVSSTYNVETDENPRGRGCWFMERMYSLTRCGSREAAASAAYSMALQGQEVVFSCVMRLGETPDDRSGPFERVDEIWDLADEANDLNSIRVFY